VSFLAANPALLDQSISVVEQSSVIGAGAFENFDILSGSNGSSFFRTIRTDGPFGWIFRKADLMPVTTAACPVRLNLVSVAFQRLGAAISTRISTDGLRLNSRVTSINVQRDPNRPIDVVLDDGLTIRTRKCVLASGRREVLHEELLQYQSKAWLSSQVLDVRNRKQLRDCLAHSGGGSVIILGNSHSAFAVVQLLLELVQQLSSQQRRFVAPTISILHRRQVRLQYASMSDATRFQNSEWEEIADPMQSICPQTGIVFRDSGLRHEYARLYLSIVTGRCAHVKLRHIPRSIEWAPFLRDANIVVQALGYRGSAPMITVDGECVRREDSLAQLATDDNGFIQLPGLGEHSTLAAIRVEPTPKESRDRAAYGSDLYFRLGRSLRDESRVSRQRVSASA